MKNRKPASKGFQIVFCAIIGFVVCNVLSVQFLGGMGVHLHDHMGYFYPSYGGDIPYSVGT
jgi:hypothetical protein